MRFSILRQSPYRWGPADLKVPHVPQVNRAVQSHNVAGMTSNHRMKEGSIARRRFLERGAATDYGAQMTVCNFQSVRKIFINQKAEYGIIATEGFRLTFAQMNQIGLHLNRELNKAETKLRQMGARAYFRVPTPYIPVTKRANNVTRGGGKNRVVTWATPVKARQVILEVDVDCSYEHIYPVLEAACQAIQGQKMDYYQNFGYARMVPMSRTYLTKMYEEERKIEMANENFFTHR